MSMVMSFRGFFGTCARSHLEHDDARHEAVSAEQRIDRTNVLSTDRGSCTVPFAQQRLASVQ